MSRLILQWQRITLPEEGIETLFGSYDENLKHLESLFGVRIRTQGHDLLVDGGRPAVDKVERLVGQLARSCATATSSRTAT